MSEHPQRVLPSLRETSKESLSFRIHDYESDVYPIYESGSHWSYRWWQVASWTAIFAGFLTGVLGAFKETGLLTGKLWGVILIVLPMLGSLAAVRQERILDRKNLFESGRQKLKSILRNAEQRFAAACQGKDDFAKIEEELRVSVGCNRGLTSFRFCDHRTR